MSYLPTRITCTSPGPCIPTIRGDSRVFTDAIRQGGKDQGKSVGKSDGKISVARLGVQPGPIDFAEIFRAAGPHLSELAAARARCVPR